MLRTEVQRDGGGDRRPARPDPGGGALTARFRLSRDARLVRFPATDGIRLEGRLTPAPGGRAAVLCHPHPRHGGSMLTPVIMTAEQVLQGAGWTTLAFNFRGVGASEGAYGGGGPEQADVAGALDFAATAARAAGAVAGAPPTLAVVGYSFGSFAGGQVAARDPRVSLFLGIAPPLDRYDFAFLRAARCRVALIGAARDEFCDAARLDGLAASLAPAAWLHVVDTDHFFTDALDDLRRAVAAAIAGSEPDGAPPGAGAACP